MKLYSHRFSRATVFVALLFILILSPDKIFGLSFDYRCLWVVRNALTSPESIDDVIDFAVQNHFNHLIVQVRGRGDAYYRSGLVPRSALIPDDEFDPLDYFITKAHQKGIQVHAWVNVYVIWSAKSKPVAENHLFNLHPDWIDGDGDVQDLQTFLLSYPNNLTDGDEGFYLAPHHPDVTPHLLAVFRELVTNYKIDGLHLDYVRYKDSDFGKNSVAMRKYREAVGEDPAIFLSTKRVIPQADIKFSARLTKWSDYRRRAITDLVKQTKEMLLEVRKDCILSAAVKPNLYLAKDRYFQEWDVWLAAGYLDWAIPMNYTQSIRKFASNIDIIYDNLPRKYRDRIIMGISTYNQSSPDAADKIKYSRITRFPGISIFSYNVLRRNPRYIGPLREQILP